MEIDITDFMRDADPAEFSASRAELGDNAGPITWNNAKDEAESRRLIDAEHRDEFERWAREFGAWSAEEIAAWSLTECNALLIQYISGELRELESLCSDDNGEIDWQEAEKLSKQGTISGSISPGDNGRIWFYMGN